jgi:hypothetical protein
MYVSDRTHDRARQLEMYSCLTLAHYSSTVAVVNQLRTVLSDS